MLYLLRSILWRIFLQWGMEKMENLDMLSSTMKLKGSFLEIIVWHSDQK